MITKRQGEQLLNRWVLQTVKKSLKLVLCTQQQSWTPWATLDKANHGSASMKCRRKRLVSLGKEEDDSPMHIFVEYKGHMSNLQ